MLSIIQEGMNLSFHVSSEQWLIWIFLYNRLLVTSHCKALITRYFCILPNPFNCSSYDDVLFAHTILTKSSTRVVSNGNKMRNGPGFGGKSIKCPQLPQYDPGLKLLLGLNFKILTTRCALAITAFSVHIKSFNKAG